MALNTQIKVGADSSGVATGLEPGKRALKDFGASADGAGKSLAGMGNGTAASAQKIDSATKSMVSSIQRTTAVMDSGARGSVEYYKALANQRGVDVNVLKPYLDQLDAIKVKQAQASAAMLSGGQSLEKVEMSARATAAALRGVPAQFTDIVTSIQGGQAPLTVFLQQGGQLKDMFGGAGNAAKALGGYVLGLINPFTLVAAGVAAAGIAYMKGAAESEAYNKALILTGSAAGVTAGQLGKMAQAVSSATGGTVGAAADALAQLAGAGNIASAQFERVAAVAVQMEKTTGVAVAETVKQFAELGKDPLDASVKLNEKTKFLTLSIYEQIKALTEQGRTFEAGALAQKSYADAMDERFPKLIENLGIAERAWAGVGGAAKKAWDQFLNIGRTADPVKEVAAELKSAQDRLSMLVSQAKSATGYDRVGANADVALQEAIIANLKKQADYNANIESSKGRSAAYAARQAESTQAQIAFDKESDKYLSKAVQMQQAIAAAQERFAKVSQTPENLAKYAQEVEGIQKKFEESSKKSTKAIKENTDARRIQDERIRLSRALVTADGKAVEDANDAYKKMMDDLSKANDKYIEGLNKSADSIAENVLKLNDEEVALRISAEQKISLAQAIEGITIKRLEEKRVMELIGNNDAAAQAIAREIEQRKLLANAIDSKDAREAVSKSAADAAAEWKKTSDSINSTLTDALMRGFESGKDFAKNLRDTLLNMFKTMVLRPVISAVINPIAGALTGALGLSGAAQAAGAATSGASAIGAAGTLASLATTAASWGTAAGAGFMATIGGSTIAGGGAAGILATGGAAGAGAAGMIGALGPYALAALAVLAIHDMTKGETRNGAKYGVGTDGKAVKLEGPSGGEIAATQAQAMFNVAKSSIEGMLTGFGSKAVLTGFTAGLESSENGKGFAYATGAINGKSFGDVNTYMNSRGDKTQEQALKDYQLELTQSILEGLQVTEDIPASVAKLISDGLNGSEVKALSLEATSAILANVETLSKQVATFGAAMTQLPFASLTKLSFDTTAGLIAAAGGFERLDANLSGYYSNFYRADEQRAQSVLNLESAFSALGKTMPVLDETARDVYRSLVDEAAAKDLSVEANQKAYAALLALQGPMNELAPAFDAVGTAAGSLAENMQTLAGLQKQYDDLTLTQAQQRNKTWLELNAKDPTGGLSGLQIAIWDLNDAAAETARNIALTSTQMSWQDKINAITQDPAAIAASRSYAKQRDLASTTDPLTKALIETAYQYEDEVAARQKQADLMALQDEAMQSWITTQQAVTDAQKQYASVLKNTIGTLKDFLSSLNVGSTPGQRLSGARSDFGTLAARAASGDTSVYDKLAPAAKSFLDISKNYSKSIQDYKRDEAAVRQSLQAVIAVNQSALDKLPAEISAASDPTKEAWKALKEATDKEAYAHILVTAMSVDQIASQARLNGTTNSLETRYLELIETLPGGAALKKTFWDTMDLAIKTFVPATEADFGFADSFAATTGAADALTAALDPMGIDPKKLALSLGISEEAAKALAIALSASGISPATLATALGLTGSAADALTIALATSGVSPAALAKSLGLTGSAADALTIALATSGVSPAALAKSLGLTGSAADALTKALSENAIDPKKLAVALGLTESAAGYLASAMSVDGLDPAELATALGLTATAADTLTSVLSKSGLDPAAVAAALGLTGAAAQKLTTALSATGVSPAELAKSLGLTGTAADSLAKALDPTSIKVASLAEALGLPDAAARILGVALTDYAARISAAVVPTISTPTASTAYGAGPISDAYQTLFGRTPDAVGAEFWKASGLTGSALFEGIRAGAQSSDIDAKKLRGYAIGTNYVMQDGPAYLHQGEAVVPKAYNPAIATQARDEAVVAEIRALREEVTLLRSEAKAGQNAIAHNTRKAAESLDKFDIDGLPATRS